MVEDALNVLTFTPTKSASILLNVLKSACANAQNGDKELDLDDLYVKEILVNEGRCLKRFMPRAQGRATKIHKRSSHITIILEEGQD